VFFIISSSFIAMDGHRYFSLFDDAMISMRYASNLAHGNGLVWNMGERVEGYTNLLMVLIMTPVNAIVTARRFASLPVQVLGIVTLLGISYFGLKVMRDLEPDLGKRAAWLEPAYLISVLFYYPLAYWSLMGMETGLLSLLLVAGIAYGFKARKDQQSKPLALMTLFFGLAYLTRPDSLLFAGLSIGLLFLDALVQKSGRRWMVTMLGFSLLLALFPLGQLLFRWTYYHELVPNTYLLKIQGFPLNLRIQNGLAFIKPFISEISLFAFFAIIALILDYSWKRLVIVSLFIVSVLYQIWTGGDAWRMWRFSAPMIPLLFAVALLEMNRIIRACIVIYKTPEGRTQLFKNPVWENRWFEKIWNFMEDARLLFSLAIFLLVSSFGVDLIGLSGSGFGEEQRALFLLGVVLLILASVQMVRKGSHIESSHRAEQSITLGIFFVAILIANGRFLSGLTIKGSPLLVDDNKLNVNRAIAINELTTEHATIGVTAAGVLPYFTNRFAIDFLGKMDRHIASLPADVSGGVAYGSMLTWPGHNKYDLEYSILELRPTYAQHLNWGGQNIAQEASTLYSTVEYQGITLYLLRDSVEVYWEKLDP
jgi:hypothetical protein